MKAGGAPAAKTERDENFPVASRLIAPHLRAPILAFYRFARKADDFADHPALAPRAKLDALDALDATLAGSRDADPDAAALRATLAARKLSPAHAHDLIAAFRLDVTQRRYRDWPALMGYCALSAMPVGRFVLDVHGESPALWPASDAICASLQVINHLQDCGEDYARLDRVYLPEDALRRTGATCADLAAPRASPALRAAIVDLAQKAGALLDDGAALSQPRRGLAPRLRDRRDRAAGARQCPPPAEIRSAGGARPSRPRGVRLVGPDRRRARRSRAGDARRQAGPCRGGAQVNASAPALPAPRGSSFYAAMRILPRNKREAMFEIYGFCRAVDDIADDCSRPRQTRHGELQAWRADIEAIFAGAPPGRLPGLAAAIRAYDLQRRDFLAVIDGMEMDVAADIRAPDWATLELYCDRVACAVGRLSTRVFGLEARAGEALAEHLGRALQLTNILRDLDEDCALGRLYLPREALDQAGIDARDPAAALNSPAIDAAARPVVAEAQRRFRLAREIMDACPRSNVRAPQLMAAVYGAILERLVARGFAAPRAPVRAPLPGLLIAVLRYGFL